jgi:hypothetical protein
MACATLIGNLRAGECANLRRGVEMTSLRNRPADFLRYLATKLIHSCPQTAFATYHSSFRSLGAMGRSTMVSKISKLPFLNPMQEAPRDGSEIIAMTKHGTVAKASFSSPGFWLLFNITTTPHGRVTPESELAGWWPMPEVRN